MNMDGANIKRIFISHASKDRPFGDAVVSLLRGIGLAQNQIIYTSDPNYGIPPGQNIFDFLRDQINNDTYMIYLLSNNYYNSVVCLNEMGAAWVRQTDAQMLLLPGFDTSDPKFQASVSNSHKLAARMDDDILMQKIVGNIIHIFNLNPLNMSIQDVYQNYIQKIEELKRGPGIQPTIGLAETESALRGKPQDPSLHHAKGYYLYEADHQKYPESAQSLLYAMYLDPRYSEAYYRLVQIAGNRHDFSRSLAVAEEALRRFPQNPSSYGCRAYALKNLGRDAEAVKDLCEAIQRGPDKWFYYLRATSYQALGDVENALSDLWTVYHQYDLNYADTVNRITEICKKIGTTNLFKTANDLKEQALEAQKGDVAETAPALFAKARKYFECILLTEPNNKDALRECGGLCYNANKFDQALQYWTQLLTLSQTSYHYYLCALANKYMGNEDEMKKLVTLGLDCPDDGWHKRLQAML